ncbi:hypothetical protein HHX38_08470 [Streptomyces sp. PKU-MA01144]|uniref:hypothetical protein n=1 Tax=Streptomyces sp. PKU-MA01144 TaxID=2729138 RepID=UPI00147EA554|nr:hypothetical protein [Streptomyces sp. PKU-MA01144]NNJ04167.1 hypothetical protein [Streptomyces sp. PKU-MA01144]
MTERTEPLDMDALLARILTEPTIGARILLATARVLENEQPFLVLAPEDLADALTKGTEQATANPALPDLVIEEGMLRAYAVTPDIRPGETAGEFALRLRDAAKAL